MQTFTLEEAAALIANKYGWHEGAQDTLLEQLVDAARAGMLTVRHPHTDLPYRPKQYRQFYEKVSASDLNRYFEGVGVPWRLDNDGETGDPIFDTEWWNQMQVLAWVLLGDRSVVREAGLPANERGHFFAEHTMPDGRREIVKVRDGRFTTVSLCARQADRGGSAFYPTLPMAKNAIIEALKAGKLTACGLQNGSGDLKEIPALSWADLELWYDPDFAGPKDLFRHGATHWDALRFKSKAVLAIWPDPLASAKEQPAVPAAPSAALIPDDQSIVRGPSARAGDNAFKNMVGLSWGEITMTFIEPEAVRIRAGGESRTFTYEVMGFKNHQSRMAKPNLVWDTLRTIAIVINTDKNLTDALPPQTDFKRRVSRLRVALQEFFGIEDDPIPYDAGGYRPAFSLTVEDHVIRHVRDRGIDDAEDKKDSEEPTWG